jgi:hypothetical protein
MVGLGCIYKVGVRLQVQPQAVQIVFLDSGDDVFEGRGTLIEQRTFRRQLGVGEESVGCSYPYNALRILIYRIDIIAASADMLVVALLLCRQGNREKDKVK